ncbi:hypothetical protein BGAL_0084g00110 [Botrytis galanthina]|uniref:Uncharacterized protein n=1 Tax=Botrytis galanthina TaxID=278940 RepID=A0A4S8R577_9HELO|nr:hypothetical protein BGAL_0084g00110 [Botrytis galanthina]
MSWHLVGKAGLKAARSTGHDGLIVTVLMNLAAAAVWTQAICEAWVSADIGQESILVISISDVNICKVGDFQMINIPSKIGFRSERLHIVECQNLRAFKTSNLVPLYGFNLRTD